MSILKKKIIIFLIVTLSLFAFAQVGLAQALVVEFEATPLFLEANFLPSDFVERYIKITNTGDREKQVIVAAANVNDPDGFAEAFNIEIRESAILLYFDTLANFFNEDEVGLSNLGSGNQTQYDFKIALEPGTGDGYQEKQLGFDIVIGFQGETAVGGEGGAGGSGTTIAGGAGGGGTGGAQGLQIFNEMALPITIDQAVVTWQTNYAATSRVIYGTVSGVFDLNSSPNYGYPFSTLEFNAPASANGLVNHIINLSGLIPGITYYYRVVSTASPATISFERSFIINPEQLSESGEFDYFGSGNNDLFGGGLVLGESKEVEGIIEGVTQEFVEKESKDSDELFVAQIATAFSFSWPWWMLTLVLIIIYLIFRKKKKEE